MAKTNTPPYFNHPTISAVAKILQERFRVEGGMVLLRRSARIRLAVAGTDHDESRVTHAVEDEGWISTPDLVTSIIVGVQKAADDQVEP